MFEISPDARVLGPWGKAGKAKVPHPLVCHVIDTAAVAEQLYDVLLGPEVRRALETGLASLGDVRSWVAVLCGLHDIGKCSPIFQAMRPELVCYLGEEARELVENLHESSKDPQVKTMHGTLTAVHLRDCLPAWGASPELRDALAYGLGGHHGSLLSAHAVQRASDKRRHHGEGPWRELRAELVRTVAELWELGDPERAAWHAASLDVPGMVGIAGLASVSDWIASDVMNFPFAELPLTDLGAYRDRARAQAATAVVERLRWKPWIPPVDTSYSALFSGQRRPLQEAVEELVAGRDEPGVLVIEAPTGEGKTRAGFQAAAALVRQLGLSGMYFALPTRATAAQVHAELAKAGSALGLEEPPNLVQAGSDLAPLSVDEDGDGEHDGHEWFTRKRGLLFPVGVGTIDQALQAVIRSRHVFVRLTGLSGKVLVLDEVHDVDAHMTTLLRRLMWWCGRFGVPVVLMSATLPAGDREHLIAQWRAGRRGLGPAKAEPLPTEPGGQQVSWTGACGEPERRRIGLSEINARRPAVAVHHLPEEELTGWLRERVRFGGCALVIRNLVRDAQQTHEALAEEIKTWDRKPELRFLTGQTPKAQRAGIEDWLRANFGPETVDRPHAIVIGTQVLQHSLDLDFDLLASDLAPINELIQRLGRIHRHLRAKARMIPEPEFALVQPPEGKEGPVFARGLHNVYHYALLLRTWNVLWGRAELKLPSETADLVHHVYSAPAQVQGPLRRRVEKAELSMSTQDNDDESRVRRFYLPALRPGDSVRDLTYQPTVAARTRKDTPWKERT
ncbi:CRISPR-associated helicase/endonuclease Cas3 [Saccharopolyspora subtropica]|uniref:CRISPR-associated helicase/endonuclease Cas3 n=1 Tax=Saccharopolyspora thermophila TaxID=89367 RepID=A0A917K4I5_9PSEU|nr:CRISPR-associated helicase Cas3' [Saccharopolyspora subtropica]GGI97919.1 CRISPR-associated helicase/endonuclease Cas3 [Saccharopolyspora subtropica]